MSDTPSMLLFHFQVHQLRPPHLQELIYFSLAINVFTFRETLQCGGTVKGTSQEKDIPGLQMGDIFLEGRNQEKCLGILTVVRVHA